MCWDVRSRASRKIVRRRAFSLAEMMIALVILGFGLVVVGAALPIGLRYSQQSADLVVGEQAGEEALETVAGRLCLRKNEQPAAILGTPRMDPVFRPRRGDLTGFLDVQSDWEPRIKVRPVLAETINLNQANQTSMAQAILTTQNVAALDQIVLCSEGLLSAWVDYAGAIPPPLYSQPLEYDLRRVAPVLNVAALSYPAAESYELAANPAPYSAASFNYIDYWTNAQSWYKLAPAQAALLYGEVSKLRQRRTTFAAFYRRVDYGNAGPDGYKSADDVPGDDSLYEIIVVVMRRPTEKHRFAVYRFPSLSWTNFSGVHDRAGGVPVDSLTPVPILATFIGALPPTGPLAPGPADFALPLNERVLNPNYTAPPSLTFSASSFVGEMLPPGAVFIPAVNDDVPDALNNPGAAVGPLPPLGPVRHAGFIPHAPKECPVFRVRERRKLANGDYEVVVDNNGFLPWSFTRGANEWPVWIVPPPFAEMQAGPGGARPVYGDDSGVIAVHRKMVRLSTMP